MIDERLSTGMETDDFLPSEFEGCYRFKHEPGAASEICFVEVGTKDAPFLGVESRRYMFTDDYNAREAITLAKDVLAIADNFIGQIIGRMTYRDILGDADYDDIFHEVLKELRAPLKDLDDKHTEEKDNVANVNFFDEHLDVENFFRDTGRFIFEACGGDYKRAFELAGIRQDVIRKLAKQHNINIDDEFLDDQRADESDAHKVEDTDTEAAPF